MDVEIEGGEGDGDLDVIRRPLVASTFTRSVVESAARLRLYAATAAIVESRDDALTVHPGTCGVSPPATAA